ncbi:anaphase-promoting complex subunit 4 WD40 domain-containing protein [Hirsutella rhossiliensis]|uniref:Anaphase-promoting complex subunit 4 WD40 domain-containing protein n=1 Tax=Hirsutella rhossiliensis TaxID=111463 RepID=A0A9P8N026_9HYPO|nr:anaphase-promoting complex subunit 4 WD40 domain-containing protein [Hirsutella rhossiliensis]KAH0964427.1 anaphase-promoting complex subunit 4 WD40 domain-containing protein [Hirsutella rhossiliensis]
MSTSSKRAISDAKTSSVSGPPRLTTPPPPSARGLLEPKQADDGKSFGRICSNGFGASDSARSIAIDANAVESALLKELQRPHRESTPGASPHRKRQRINGDRFIPSRSGQDLQASFSLLHEDGSPATPSRQKKRTPHGELHFQKTEEANRTFSTLLRAELFESSVIRRPQKPRKPRAVSKVPYKVLDAPELADDFYLNLVDWGSANVLGVGLGSSVYMWNAQTSKVNKLCTLEDDTVTSVSWIQKGTHLAVGTGKGLVQIWDAERTRRLRTMTGHTARVGSLAWNTHILTSGSRDRLIYHRDVRAPDQWLRKLVGHKQEVCGLKWNCEDGQLASGGNDNKLMVWDKLSETPLWKFSDHTAAVKAIAWSPHQRGLLASGGGTADRRIVFHDTVKGSVINEIDTGSQVCNLAWSKNSNELVSTHGYSQNQIVVWKYPSMTQVASLTGHTYRVLYLAMSPDGRVVVTGAGDETLRFWSVFGRRPGAREDGETGGGRLADWGIIR